MNYQFLISVFTIALSFAAYIPYIVDIVKNKTKPHVFTWFATTITAFTAYGLQVVGNAGVGSLTMLVISCICVVVFILSVWKGTKDITRSDIFFLIASLLALIVWVYAEQPILSVILITAAEVLGFIPTIRKSWKDPRSETLSLYTISIVRHTASIFALESLNLLTVLYPAVWAIMCVIIAGILLYRRSYLAKPV